MVGVPSSVTPEPSSLILSGTGLLGLASFLRRRATAVLNRAEGLALERPPLPISSIYRQATAVGSTLGEGRPSYPLVRTLEVGYKFGRFLDLIFLQRLLTPSEAPLQATQT